MEEESAETQASANISSESMQNAEVMSDVHLGCPSNFSGPYTSHFTISVPPVVYFRSIVLDDDDVEMKMRTSIMMVMSVLWSRIVLVILVGQKLNFGEPKEEYYVNVDEREPSTHVEEEKKEKFESEPNPNLSNATDLSIQGVDVRIKDESSSLQQTVDLDEDGDLIVARRIKQLNYTVVVNIQHNITSTIPSVGLQVWRAELILADYVLHKMSSSSVFNGVIAVELGAGTGLVGILMVRVADAVYITDHGVEVLDNCATNVHINTGLLISESSVKVRELDWLKPWLPLDLDSGLRYSWTTNEVEELDRANVLLAADVIYSDELTDAFFSILQKMMCQHSEKVLYLALEKRYNFSLYDLNIVANGYSHFLSFLRDENGFSGKRIDLSVIPQYVTDYERGNDVELWEIKYVVPQG